MVWLVEMLVSWMIERRLVSLRAKEKTVLEKLQDPRFKLQETMYESKLADIRREINDLEPDLLCRKEQ